MSSHRLLVIGLDGAPFDLIQQWTQCAYMPNLARLIERGSFGVLRSTIPVHSPTAWASFITGLNPGKHGVFDFAQREANSYRLRVVLANQIKGASLWRLLNEQGRYVGVVNVPMTYPPEPVRGFLVSGLGTPDYVPYTHPPELSDALNKEGYRVNKQTFFQPGKENKWLTEIYEVTERQAKAALRLIREHPCDFFMYVFRDTDEICHFFWRYMDSSHPEYDPDAPEEYRTAIRDYYQYVDGWLGELIAAAGENTNVVIMSDHGAGPLYKDVFLNEWLWQQGWLKLTPAITAKELSLSNWFRKVGLTRKNISELLTVSRLHWLEVLLKKALGDHIMVLPRDERPEFIEAIDWTQTKAYSFGYYGQIFINLKGREPNGIVEPGAEYEQLRQEIANRLAQLVDPEDGLPVVDKVYFKEELFHGNSLDDAPDILAIMRGLSYITRKGYEFAEERGVLFRQPYTNESGSHRLEGILVAAGPDIIANQQVEPKEIQDLTPTLLRLMDCPIPPSMDGQSIESLLTSRYRMQHPLRYGDDQESMWSDRPQDWDEQSEAEIIQRLKNLGYLS